MSIGYTCNTYFNSYYFFQECQVNILILYLCWAIDIIYLVTTCFVNWQNENTDKVKPSQMLLLATARSTSIRMHNIVIINIVIIINSINYINHSIHTLNIFISIINNAKDWLVPETDWSLILQSNLLDK